MAKVKIPEEKEIQERREEAYANDQRWIVNPSHVTISDEIRVKSWAHALMSKNEYKFNDTWKHAQIVTSGEVEPEAIDIRAVYPFPDLHWFIFKNHKLWSFRLVSKDRMLFQIDFAQI